MNERDPRRVRGPQDLASSVAPARDLWPGIAAAIARLPQDGVLEGETSGATVQVNATRDATAMPATAPSPATAAVAMLPPRRRPAAWTYGLGLAATVACVAIGVWIGRSSMPAAVAPTAGVAATPVTSVAFAPDARYGREREVLLAQAVVGLSQLAPADRAKVEASLATIRGAIADIREALGTDPGNQLLQEMLVNSYQDEIRVLTAVMEAGASGQEI